MSKKVLVTGGAGFIGSHTVDALIERGDTVRVFDNLNSQVHGPLAEKPLYLHEGAEFIQGDMRDRDSLRKAIEGMDIIIHDAAEVGVGQSMYSIDQYISTNVGGTGILWDILVNVSNNVEKVLVASSMSNYGEGRYICSEHGKISPKPRPIEQMQAGQWEMLCPACKQPATPIPTDEDKAMHCTSVYAQSKKDQEVYSLMIGEAYKIPTVTCRYFNCYGPRQSLNNPYTGATAIFCSAIKNGKAPLVYEDGHQQRDFIHVKDLVRGKLMLLDSSESNYQVFNIGRGKPGSILEVAKTLIEIFGKSLTPESVTKTYDGIYTSNVLEHIEDDVETLRKIHGMLKPGCNLVIYVPAFMCLYSELDSSIGHYRRYHKKELLEKLRGNRFEVIDSFYVDSIGFFASLAIKFFGYKGSLRLGNKGSLLIYDKYIYSISKILDGLGLKYFFGKNILVAARRRD